MPRRRRLLCLSHRGGMAGLRVGGVGGVGCLLAKSDCRVTAGACVSQYQVSKGIGGIVCTNWVNGERAWRRWFWDQGCFWAEGKTVMTTNSLKFSHLGSHPLKNYLVVTACIFLTELLPLWLMSVLSSYYFCLWMVMCRCSLLRQGRLLLLFVEHRPFYSMGECVAPKGCVGQGGGGVWGGPYPTTTTTNTTMLSSPITERNLAPRDVKQTHCKWHFYLLAFASPPPTALIHWEPRGRVQGPHGNSKPCQHGGQLSHDVITAQSLASLWKTDEASLWVIRVAAELMFSVRTPNFGLTWSWCVTVNSCFDLEGSGLSHFKDTSHVLADFKHKSSSRHWTSFTFFFTLCH